MKELNRLAQERRLSLGELERTSSYFLEDVRYFANDRVVFTKNQRDCGVINGDFGTIEAIDERWGKPFFTVRLDRTEDTRTVPASAPQPVRVTIDPTQTKELELGYASTTHKAQGATVDRAFLLVGGGMQDRELSYVQVSRAREQTKIFATGAAVGDDLEQLAREMGRSRQKEIAHQVEERSRSPIREHEMLRLAGGRGLRLPGGVELELERGR